MWGDILGYFVGACLREHPRRICIVTPWIGEVDHGHLDRLTCHARSCRAEMVLVTRPGALYSAEGAVKMVMRLDAHSVLVNERLHAKLCVCEADDGRGVALIGSANLTASGTRLDEAGVLVRPLADSRIISELSQVALTHLAGREIQVARPGRRPA